MSQHKNANVRELLKSFQGLTTEEIEELVGVEISESGSVYDIFDDLTYTSIQAWAEAQGGPEKEHFYHGSEKFD